MMSRVLQVLCLNVSRKMDKMDVHFSFVIVTPFHDCVKWCEEGLKQRQGSSIRRSLLSLSLQTANPPRGRPIQDLVVHNFKPN